MSAILNLLAGSGGVVYTPTFVVNVGGGFNTGVGGQSYIFYGWCPYAVTPGPNGAFYPDATMGSVSSGIPGLNLLSINGAYSVGAPNGSGIDAAQYIILVVGNVSSGISNMSVGGTNIGGVPTYTYDSTRNVTRVVWNRVDTTTLFGFSGTKTVVVS